MLWAGTRRRRCPRRRLGMCGAGRDGDHERVAACVTPACAPCENERATHAARRLAEARTNSALALLQRGIDVMGCCSCRQPWRAAEKVALDTRAARGCPTSRVAGAFINARGGHPVPRNSRVVWCRRARTAYARGRAFRKCGSMRGLV